VALAGIPPWRDQAIELFHGTTDAWVHDILQSVDETAGGAYKDFGRGFYTTTRLDKAHEWAIVKARRAGGAAAVLRFDVSRNDLAQLDCLFFACGDAHAVDYWSFVQYCRTIGRDHNRLHSPWYDLVVGPVSGTWRRQTILPNADQISFHTPYAVAVLNAGAKVRVV
jgi:Protein of unknown function (DUF3990)